MKSVSMIIFKIVQGRGNICALKIYDYSSLLFSTYCLCILGKVSETVCT